MCFRPAAAEKRKNICPNCMVENPPEATVCSECGEELMNMPPLPGQSGGLTPPKAPPAPPKKTEE